jgi:hypothetical protein
MVGSAPVKKSVLEKELAELVADREPGESVDTGKVGLSRVTGNGDLTQLGDGYPNA